MKATSRPALRALGLFAFSTLVNFAIFIVNYRTLAFPYLSEEQRVENADRILTLTLLTFALAAAATALLAYWFMLRASRGRGEQA